MIRGAELKILKILQEFSDKYHPLTKEEIREHFRDIYGEDFDDKMFFRKISELQEADWDVVATKGKYAKYYLEVNRLTPNEYLYLNIMLMGSSDISTNEAKRIIDVLNERPVNNLSAERCAKYKNKLRTNNSLTKQIDHFATLMDAYENKREVSYRQIIDYSTKEFSETRFGTPEDFLIVDNQIIFVIREGKKLQKYLLKSLIEVQENF